MRAFVALPVPDEALRDVVALQARAPFGRPVDEENLHLTLAFLGERSRPELQELAAELDRITGPAADVRLTSLDIFGAGHQALVAAAADRSESLVRLQGKVAGAARAAGIALERRRFRPHVSILRLKAREGPADPRMQAYLAGTGTFEIAWRARSLVLYRSILGPGGAIYDPLADFPLT